MNSVLVLGGGTAGLVAAITLKQSFPNYNITIVESDTIGIIGVGEGSTEHWRRWVEYVNLDVRECIRETEGALKKGIKFENWNGDGKSYFHSLAEPFYSEYNTDPGQRNLFVKTLLMNNIKTEDILLETNLTSYHAGITSVNQYHFNTFKLNDFIMPRLTKKWGSRFKEIHGNVGEIKRIGRVAVPKLCWKVVHDIKTKEWFFFLFDNVADKPSGLKSHEVDRATIEKESGFKFK